MDTGEAREPRGHPIPLSPTLALQATGELGSPILPATPCQERGSDPHLALCEGCLHPILVGGDLGSQS